MDRPLPTPEEVWRLYDADEQRLTAALSERMLDLAGVAAGTRVLDLATGRGEPAVRAAHRVGVTGEVLGVDVAEAMLRRAQAGADAALVAWVRAFGLTRLLNGLPEATPRAWERDFGAAAAPLRRDRYVRLGGLTRVVVAEKPAAPCAGR